MDSPIKYIPTVTREEQPKIKHYGFCIRQMTTLSCLGVSVDADNCLILQYIIHEQFNVVVNRWYFA